MCVCVHVRVCKGQQNGCVCTCTCVCVRENKMDQGEQQNRTNIGSLLSFAPGICVFSFYSQMQLLVYPVVSHCTVYIVTHSSGTQQLIMETLILTNNNRFTPLYTVHTFDQILFKWVFLFGYLRNKFSHNILIVRASVPAISSCLCTII